MDRTFKLEDLAREADVSPRTVRYYVQRGLLPAPAFRGRDTVYTQDHLDRLKAIRKLQEQYLPLDAIAAEMAQKRPEEILERPTPLPIPPPLPRPGPGPARGERWTRYQIRDGVEIHVREDVVASVGNLAGELAKLFDQGGPYR